MPINPSIALSLQPMKAPDIEGAMRLSDLVRARQDDDAARQAFVFQDSGLIDRPRTMQNLSRINPKYAMQQAHNWEMEDSWRERNTRENERVQALTQKNEMLKRRQAQVGAAQEYFRTLQNSGDERLATEAANSWMVRAGLKEPFSLESLQFDGGGMGDEGGEDGGMMDASFAPGADAGGFLPVASPGGKPAPMPNQGRPAPAAPQATPLQPVDPENMPDTATAPGRVGPGYNWQKSYLYTKLFYPKSNPLASTTVLDWRTGQPIVNEPLVGARERVAAAGRTTVNAAGGNIELGKPAQNKVDESLLNTGARIQRLKEVESIMKPEYLQFGTMAKGGWANLKDKFGLASAQEKQLVADMATAYSTAFEDLNATIKEASGATVTDGEAQRLFKQMPKPPTGPLDWGADGPSEYFAKLKQNVRVLKLAEARLSYIKRNGMTLEDGARKVPLEQMPTFMNKRGAELDAQFKKQFPNMREAERDKEVRRALASEFGLIQ